ncbi:MAG TPA: ATP-binding protein, partial [Bacteroidales bacterium]|nr:ATP-binding protein [Bacteroidales bacterium]
MPDYITRLIAGGESQTLDFKFEVSDFRKIARTLVAFSNTDGGRLLVGVKDNGSIAGVRSEEEYYMIEGAARLYCRPEIMFSVKEWQADRKKILEVIIDRGKEVPYKAMDDEG